MNVVVNSQILAAELRLLNRVVPTKPAVAILSHALLRADEDGVSFYATDLEVALSGSCAGRVDAPGQAAVPVAKLLQMVEQFADGDVELTSGGNQLGVRCGAFSSKLQALPVDDFPMQPEVAGQVVEIDAASLRQLIGKTRHAINASGTKHVLKGALLTFVGDAVAMVATDGQRLSLATAGRKGEDLDVVVPAKALDALAAGAEEGTVTLTVGDRHLFFALGGRQLTSRKLEGRFPAYDRIIPRDNDQLIDVDRAAWIAALRRVVLTAEETSAVYLALTPGWMRMTSASVGIGSSGEDVEVRYDGELKACVNGPYLLDFLNAAAGASVTMALKDADGHVLLTDGDHLGVVALMRHR